jgi:hypothetical protein
MAALTRKMTSRTVLNRAAFHEIDLALADALFEEAVRIVESAHPPDAPPFGEGLLEGGGAIAWAGTKKVNGTTIGGKQIVKPRALKLDPTKVTAIAGWGFPARFVELGTIDTPAEPFLGPAAAAEAPGAKAAIGRALGASLAARGVTR